MFSEVQLHILLVQLLKCLFLKMHVGLANWQLGPDELACE